LWDSVMKEANRVACPRHTGNTPVAIGSRVPACPTRRCPLHRRTMETTFAEVFPKGLLMFRKPLTLNACSSALGDLFYQVEDLGAALDSVILAEYQLGRMPQG
jgi:hypothetical protein